MSEFNRNLPVKREPSQPPAPLWLQAAPAVVRGAALVACGQAGLPTSEYAPAHVKVAVSGYGRAGKGQVQQMVRRLLTLEAEPRPDEADALAVAICHMLEGRRTEAVARASRPVSLGRRSSRPRGRA